MCAFNRKMYEKRGIERTRECVCVRARVCVRACVRARVCVIGCVRLSSGVCFHAFAGDNERSS